MTVQFSGVHFLYRPAEDERRFVQSLMDEPALSDDGIDVVTQDGDVLVLNTGTPDFNPLDDLVREGLTAVGPFGEVKVESQTRDGDVQIEGYRSAGRKRSLRAVLENMLDGGGATRDDLTDMKKPNYFIASGSSPFSQERIGELAQKLQADGRL